MNKLNTFCALALLFCTFTLGAQVSFKLSYTKETGRYTVSVIPAVSYNHPQNITASGQVTIKVAANDFDPVDIENHLEGMIWEANARSNSPEEAPDYDYISFGLIIQGIAYPEYQAGEELPLFSFENAYGCKGKVFLVDNVNDAFMPPNSQNANIGNALTILGAGGDAYNGIEGDGECNCAESTTMTAEELGLASFRVFPNPATDFINVNLNWKGVAGDAAIQVVDATGKQVLAKPVDLSNGKVNQKLIVSDLTSGAYWIYLAGKDWKLSLDSFTKQ